MSSPIVPSNRPEDAALSAPPADPTFYLPTVESSRFLDALRRFGWLAVLLAVAAAGGTWYALDRVPETYLASGSVYVSTQAPEFFEIEGLGAEESRDLEQLQSVEQGMLSKSLLLRLIERHGLMEDDSFAPEAASRQQVLGVLAERVHVALRRGTRLLDIAVEDTDPERARDLVDSIKREYEAWSAERQASLIAQASDGLTREESRLRERMEAAEAALREFRGAHPVPGLGREFGGGPERDGFAALSSRLTEARARRLEIESERDAFARFEAADGEIDPDRLAGLSESEHGGEVLELVRALREKELDFDRVKQRYLFKHPEYKRAAREVESVGESIREAVATAAEALEKSYRIAKANEEKLSREVAEARLDVVDIDALRAEFASLTRRAERAREQHQLVEQKLRQTHLAGSVPSSVLSWRDQPLAPEEAFRPRKTFFAGLAGLGGLGFGLLAVAGLEFTDRRVRDTAAASRATGVPLLSRLPETEGADGMLLLSAPASAAAEAFRRLRAVLLPPDRERGPRTLLFTSGRRGEGASFCAVNHAVSLAVQGHRTLLIDADLRSPGLSRERLRQTGGERGLGGYLAGEAEAAEACVRTPVDRLFLLASGELRPDAAELLSGTRFAALLEEAHRWFDRVVIDAPAVLDASDAQAVARYADRTCLVVGRDGSNRRELRQTAELLRTTGANLVGFVWNERKTRAGETPPLSLPTPAIPEYTETSGEVNRSSDAGISYRPPKAD